MTEYAVNRDWPDTITFDRIHALAKRGYRACLGVAGDDDGFARIDLWHPRAKGQNVPPKLTIWSNGIVATNQLLWPSRYVSQEDGTVPGWQKFIDVTDGDVFRSFVESVPMPTLLDLYVNPGVAHAKLFAARLMFGFSLCGIIAGTLMLTEKLITGGEAAASGRARPALEQPRQWTAMFRRPGPLSDDTRAIDRGLLRRLDWTPPHQGPRSVSVSPHALPPPVDVTAVIEAARHLAPSMSTMAELIGELEGHAEAFATSNEQLEANNRQLTLEIGEAIHERESLATSLSDGGKKA